MAGRRIRWGTTPNERAPRWLAVIFIGYLVWSLGPLILAVGFSFNAADSVTRWEGFSLRWWVGDPEAEESIVFDPDTRTALAHSLVLASAVTLVAVPMGSALALGVVRWRRRIGRVIGATTILALALPPLALGTELWLLFAFPLRSVPFGAFGWFGTKAQIAGLVTLFMPYAFAIVAVRVLLLEPNQEECAADLGASPTQALKRVVLPQIGPAVVAAVAIVFSGALSEFVVSRALYGTNDTRTLAMALFGAMGGPSPRHSAIGTTLAVAGALSIVVLVLAFRRTGRLTGPRRRPEHLPRR